MHDTSVGIATTSPAPLRHIDVPEERGRRIPELDGLRAVAILLVLLWHYFVLPCEAPPGSVLAYWRAALAFTWSGVDLFFVLSGFLIGGILFDSRESPNYYTTFYARRFFRIIPLYFTCCFLFRLVSEVMSPNTAGYRWLFHDSPPAIALGTFTVNLWMARLGDFGSLAYGPLWSLSVEEQFYLTLPVFLRLARGRNIRPALVTMIVVAPVIRFALFQSSSHGWIVAYTSLIGRADALIVGVLIADLFRDKDAWERLVNMRFARAFLMIATAVYLAFLTMQRANINSISVATFGYSALALFYGSVLVLVLRYPRSFSLLKLKSLMWLGSIAYATYLLHMFIYGVLFTVLLGQKPRLASGPEFLVTLLSLVTVVIVASISLMSFERPLLRVGHKFRY